MSTTLQLTPPDYSSRIIVPCSLVKTNLSVFEASEYPTMRAERKEEIQCGLVKKKGERNQKKEPVPKEKPK